ncbi:MAG: hypothetical protein VW230_06100, partial [Candidatus Poseidoniales archaeon]
ERLKSINSNLSHPEQWVRVIDDTKGNSDHFNFIMNGHTATWIRGQHQYIYEEGDACEQTPKHAQSDSVSTLNVLGGGRGGVESGLQTGLDIVATHAWWDWNIAQNDSQVISSQGDADVVSSQVIVAVLVVIVISLVAVVMRIHKINQ